MPRAVSRKNGRRWLASALVGCIGVLGVLAQTGTAQADSGSWSLSNIPNGDQFPDLNGAFCLSETDCFSVGYGETSSGPEQTLIERWNGTSWSVMSSPNEGSGDNQLNGVTCMSPTACLAVGSTGDAGGSEQTLIEVWGGVSWTIESSPNEGTGDNQLNSVTCPSSSDCLAVGFGSGSSLIESWNGDAWSITSATANAGLEGVSCVDVNYCVTVGASAYGTNTFIQSWDGSNWSEIPSPNQGTLGSELLGVSCSSTTSCVTVGDYDTANNLWQELAETWDGTSWSITQSGPLAVASELNGVSCVSSVNCTAVGYTHQQTANDTLAENWNGTSWSGVSTPNPTFVNPGLNAVSCVSIGNCIAVGNDNSGNLALTESEPTQPTVTSASSATFSAGQSGTYTITTSGYPASAISDNGATFPAGVSLVDNGDGTATLSGTPGEYTAGTYPITITASNGVSPDATQDFTLTVDPPPNSAPAITSGDATIFIAGQSETYSITTSGYPISTISDNGAVLPSGVSFMDNGDGTATLSGTPATDSTGTYPITITASNGVSPDATQDFSLTVGPPPCTPGNYSSTGAAPCNPASAGSYVATTGATSESACAVGTYQPTEGQSSCLLANPGSYVAITGAIVATECALGTFNPDSGATSCTPAPLDTYVDTTGATATTDCPAGTYTVTTGSTSAADCITPAPAITKFTPTSGPAGTVVTIKGTNLSGATKVTFNGVKGTITSDTSTKIKVKVPGGATSAKIKLTTPGGKVKTVTAFIVT